MTTPQRPINSGFTADSTIADVLDGIDLTGKLAIVTGGYSGIGTAVTRGLSDAGATVVVPARRPAQARKEIGDVPGVEIAELDLADLGSVERFASDFLATGRSISMLVNNAAVMACELTRVGPAGWESQFAIDHLGHFAHKFSGIRWDDLHWEHGYDKWQAYGQAKTANILFAVALDARGQNEGVRVFAVYPAGVRTALQRHLSQQEMRDMGWYDDEGNLAPLFKTPEQGAAGEAWAAVSPQLDGMGGVYIERCDIAEIADPGTEKGKQEGVNPDAVDSAEAERLWTVSARLTGVDAFAAAP